VNLTNLYFNGTLITATADNLNSGVASSAATLISNATLKVYGSNVQIVAGGTLTVGAGGTLTLPAGSVGSDDIAAGTMANAMTISNATTKLYGSNVEVVAGGTLTVGTGGTVTLPSESVAITALADGIVGSLTVATAPVSPTQATITVTMKDINGSALTVSKGAYCWFTTQAIQTVPDTNGIGSWSFVSHGDVRRYAYNGTGIIGYYCTSHTDGTMDFLITCEAAGWTNRFGIEGPNGCYSNLAVIYKTP
jgi:hypothetical protein